MNTASILVACVTAGRQLSRICPERGPTGEPKLRQLKFGMHYNILKVKRIIVSLITFNFI